MTLVRLSPLAPEHPDPLAALEAAAKRKRA
jgi:hypothetical protein